MTIEFSSLQTQIDRFADDHLGVDAAGDAEDRRFSLPLRIDAWNWAQKVLVHHTPREQTATLTINSDGRSADLPSDFFDVHAMYDSDEEEWWQSMSIKPGGYRDDTDPDTSEYWTWGDTLYLERELGTDDDHLTLYYWAYYPEIEYTVGLSDDGTEENKEDITYSQSTVYTPRWSDTAMIHLCIAYCWQPGSIQASDINEWRIMVDAGTPMHNPRAAAAWDHYRWWNDLMAKVNPAR
jgi:hypothetical protein